MKNVVVIAGPAGSGKDTVAQALMRRYRNVTLMVTATTRQKRPGEAEGVNYYYMTNEQFQKEIGAGNILEHYHRKDTDTYYGTYKPDIDRRVASGDVVLAVIQIVGAKYLKEHYNATTIFIIPPPMDVLERRLRARSPMSDIEWQERLEITQKELAEEAPWYDYRVENHEGMLDDTVNQIIEILKKEGYTLET